MLTLRKQEVAGLTLQQAYAHQERLNSEMAVAQSRLRKVMERNDGVRIYDEGETVTVNLNPADLMSYAPTGEEAAK